MGHYLVTGRAGAGKSTVAKTLSQRGYLAFDADDVPGLSGWYSVDTGEQVRLADNSYVDLTKLQWLWNAKVVQALITEHKDFFLCGGAHNDLSFAPLFDTTFTLQVSPAIQIARLLGRDTNEYGKDPAMHHTIVEDEAQHLAAAKAQGSIIIDADQPIESVIQQIIDRLQ